MDARPDDRARAGAAPPLAGAARRARASLEHELRIEAERLDHEIAAFYRATQERAAALAEQKVGEAAARVSTELGERVAVDSAALRSELQAEIARALAMLEAKGAQLLTDARGELDGSGRARLAEQDEDARGRFEALEHSVGERVALAETMVRERVARAVAEAQRDVSAAVDRRLEEEIARLRATTDSSQTSAARFRAEVSDHLKKSLGSAEERLRGEIASGLTAARSELAEELERQLGELRAGAEGTPARQLESLRPEIERTIDEVVEESASARFGRLAAELRATVTANLDRHAKAATERIAGSIADDLALARRQLRQELAAAATERVEALGAALREELERERRATRAGIADELGTRIEGWMANLRKRTDAAEKRLDEKVESRLAGAMRSLGGELANGGEQVAHAVAGGRGELEDQLRVVREEQERSIEVAEARIQAAVEQALEGAVGRVANIFEIEGDGLRRGLEGELERLLGVARTEVRQAATTAVLDVERGARERVEAALRRAAGELEIGGPRAKNGANGAPADGTR